jgi:hypothetical protein
MRTGIRFARKRFATDTISASINPNWNLVLGNTSRYPLPQNDNATPAGGRP